MSYEPLHHKYRPARFADLVGQEAISETLSNALRQRKIAPAYLFTGPRGTGKTSSARIMAKSLNCLQHDRPTEHPCGTCDVCQSIATGTCLDAIEIDAASNTGVDNIREIIERAQFAPVQCRYKLYIIDECHMLSTAAFNSLLKTLEEPPDRVVFILATTDPQRVLPTIISRCQRFDFRRIPLESMVQHLRKIATQETINIDDEAMALVAQIAQGGLRDAESLLDQLSLLDDRITLDGVWDLVGAVPEQDLMSLLEAIASDQPSAVIHRVRHLMNRGREPAIVLQNLAGFYRDLLIAKTAPDRSNLVALTPQTWEQLCQFAQGWDTPTILAGGQHLRACEAQLKNTTQPRLWLEVALLGLLPSASGIWDNQGSPNPREIAVPPRGASPPPQIAQVPKPSQHADLPQPLHRPRVPDNQPSQNGAAPDSLPPSASPQPGEVTNLPPVEPQPPQPPVAASNLGQIWQQVLDNIQMRATRELMRQQGHLEYFEESVAGIRIAPGLFKVTQSKLPDIEAAFKRTFHRAIVVRLETRSNSAQESTSEANTFPPNLDAPSTSPDLRTQPEAREPISDLPTVTPPPPSPPIPIAETDSPTETHPQNPDWDEQEVVSAAQRLADFFNGEVIPMNDEPEF